MKKTRFASLILFFWAMAVLCQAQEAPPWELQGSTDQSELQSFENTGMVLAKNGVIITNTTTVLTANQAMANQVTGEVSAEGEVTILGNSHVWRGTNIIYNFKTGEMRSGAFRTTLPPFFISGRNLSGGTNKIYTATNSIITSDDVTQPFYHIRARSIVISPGQYFEARAATVFMGKVPIFYFPYYRRYLGRHPNNFEFSPGYRSLFGAYLLSTYNWTASTNLDGAVHLDWRERRGLAGGPDFHYGFGKLVDANLSFYYARDEDSGADGLTPIPPRDRDRLSFIERSEITSNLTAKIVARYQRDPLIIHDFFEHEFRQNVQPNTFAEATQTWPNFTLDAMSEVRLNDFTETVERLPDIKLTGERQQVFATPVYYESESSIGYFKRLFPAGQSLTNFYSPFSTIQTNYSAARADTYHQFTLPQTFFGWLNVAPRVGGRLTYYSATDGRGVTGMSEQARGVFNTGADVSFKASRLWKEAESKTWDINGLRHIIEPSFDYVFVPAPSRSPAQLPQFDYESPSYRLLPIDFPDYNAIDSIDSQNVVRLAVRNKLQTKREGGLQNIVNWALYTDWRLDPRTNQNQLQGTYQSRFSDVYSDLDLRPRSWLTVNSQIRYGVASSSHSTNSYPGQRVIESFHSIVIQPSDVWSLGLSYRYLMNNDPEFFTPLVRTNEGNKLFTASLYYKFNENWAARVAEQFEGHTGKLEEQVYSIYRDLRSWTAGMQFRVRENSIGPTDFSVVFTYSLKAFPRYKLGSDAEHTTRLLGDY